MEQNQVKKKLKNLLGQEKYNELMTKGEMIKYLKQNINDTIINDNNNDIYDEEYEIYLSENAL
jgi:hypothetical protein